MFFRTTFRGGVHPLTETGEGKTPTRSSSIRRFLPAKVCIPMNMHLGAPSLPCVKKGDHVLVGQVIAEAQGGRGIPVHASLSGTVAEVTEKQMLAPFSAPCITIESDGQYEWIELPEPKKIGDISAQDIIPAIQAAGICGMGGACFPTHVKMSIPEGKSIDTLLINGSECETFLTSDHRLMVEYAEQIADGIRLAMKALGVKRVVVGIENNKPDAIQAMKEATEAIAEVEITALPVKYPQGGEKQLIQVLTDREVPSGGLPMDVHTVVLNVATVYAIADAVLFGKPLVCRVTTVTGAVKEPANLLLPIGTSFADAIEACGGYAEEPGKILAGGTMTGIAAPNDQVSMTKANNGIVVLTKKEAVLSEETNCIRCGKCIAACPIRLNPYHLRALIDLDQLDQAVQEHLNDCINCGACSFICPAKRWLSSSFKRAKDTLAARRVKQ